MYRVKDFSILKLERKPVIVLSNDDGCAVSRIVEAKVLGIEMATLAFTGKSVSSRKIK